MGYGFDNIGDVLSIPPLLMEKYLTAARAVADAAIYVPGVRTWHVAGGDLEGANSTVTPDGARVIYSNGDLSWTLNLPAEGDYKLTITTFEQAAGPEHARMAVHTGEGIPKMVEVTAPQGHPQKVEISFHAGPGRAAVGATFVNDYYKPKTDTTPQEDRNLGIIAYDLSGPTGAVAAPAESKIIFVRPTANNRVECERKILAAFASKAYRRPATSAEVDRLVAIAELAHKSGDSFERGIQLAVTGALCSPKFLFRVESPTNGPPGFNEMASRLSYFLWSSMPDEELFALAAKNDLQKPEVLAAQVNRMLKDPKAQALADNFEGQWLQTRKLVGLAPDRKLFPEFNDEVRQSMVTETRMFFLDVMRNDRSVLDFIDSRYSFLNGSLAKLYGVPRVFGSSVSEGAAPTTSEPGILTQASVLTVTSNPTRTSPVKRGKWILENILGTPPPPPPPECGVLKEDAGLARCGIASAADGAAPEGSRFAPLPRADGPLGFALRELRRHRRLADEGREVRHRLRPERCRTGPSSPARPSCRPS